MQTAAPVSPGPFFAGTIGLKASGLKLKPLRQQVGWQMS
jgi:hypothetical protein